MQTKILRRWREKRRHYGCIKYLHRSSRWRDFPFSAHRNNARSLRMHNNSDSEALSVDSSGNKIRNQAFERMYFWKNVLLKTCKTVKFKQYLEGFRPSLCEIPRRAPHQNTFDVDKKHGLKFERADSKKLKTGRRLTSLKLTHSARAKEKRRMNQQALPNVLR